MLNVRSGDIVGDNKIVVGEVVSIEKANMGEGSYLLKFEDTRGNLHARILTDADVIHVERDEDDGDADS